MLWDSGKLLNFRVKWPCRHYSGRDQVDEETPLIIQATSALGIHAASHPSPCVLLCSSLMPVTSPHPQPGADLKDFIRNIPTEGCC